MGQQFVSQTFKLRLSGPLRQISFSLSLSLFPGGSLWGLSTTDRSSLLLLEISSFAVCLPLSHFRILKEKRKSLGCCCCCCCLLFLSLLFSAGVWCMGRLAVIHSCAAHSFRDGLHKTPSMWNRIYSQCEKEKKKLVYYSKLPSFLPFLFPPSVLFSSFDCRKLLERGRPKLRRLGFPIFVIENRCCVIIGRRTHAHNQKRTQCITIELSPTTKCVWTRRPIFRMAA